MTDPRANIERRSNLPEPEPTGEQLEEVPVPPKITLRVEVRRRMRFLGHLKRHAASLRTPLSRQEDPDKRGPASRRTPGGTERAPSPLPVSVPRLAPRRARHRRRPPPPQHPPQP